MKLEDSFETPQNTFPTEFNLDNPKINTREALNVVRDHQKQTIKVFEDLNCILYKLPRAYAIVDLIDPHQPQLVYYMKYKETFHKFIGEQCAQQIILWSNTKHPATIGITKEVFFNHLLTSYDAIITDALQTPDGQRFWDRRVLEALSGGLNVYYVNLLPTREITLISSPAEYRALANNKEIWGDEHKHQARRIVITTKKLE